MSEPEDRMPEFACNLNLPTIHGRSFLRMISTRGVVFNRACNRRRRLPKGQSVRQSVGDRVAGSPRHRDGTRRQRLADIRPDRDDTPGARPNSQARPRHGPRRVGRTPIAGPAPGTRRTCSDADNAARPTPAILGTPATSSDADNDGATANDGWTCRFVVNAGSSALYPTTRPLAPFSPFSPSPLPHTQNQNTSPLSLSLTLL